MVSNSRKFFRCIIYNIVIMIILYRYSIVIYENKDKYIQLHFILKIHGMHFEM